MPRVRQPRSRRPPPPPAILQRHLATLRRFRDVHAFCAFVWPEDERIVYSVIDHLYGLAPEEIPDVYIQALARWEHHMHMIESYLEEEA